MAVGMNSKDVGVDATRSRETWDANGPVRRLEAKALDQPAIASIRRIRVGCSFSPVSRHTWRRS
jgi:hypothetical protein